MTDDIVKRSIDEHAPVSVEDLRAAVAEIERGQRAAAMTLRLDEAHRAIRKAAECPDNKYLAEHVHNMCEEIERLRASEAVLAERLSAFVGPTRPAHVSVTAQAASPAPAPDLESRLSRLEHSVRDNTRRLDLAYRELVDASTTPTRVVLANLCAALSPEMEGGSDV